MTKVFRFGVSIEKSLAIILDNFVKEKGYSNRSQAIRDLIRKNIIQQEWGQRGKVAGGIALVYNHHKRELVNKLMDIQHDYHKVIISTQHIHLDHDNCLEIVVVRGIVSAIEHLTNKIQAVKGVKHCVLAKTTTGEKVV